MVAENSSPGAGASEAAVREQYLRSKGLCNLTDLDDAEEALLQLQGHHELVVVVEMCEAQRPSKLGSLKGTHEKYEEEYNKLQETFAELSGDGAIRYEKWQPGMATPVEGSSLAQSAPFEAGAGRSSRPQSASTTRPRSRPQSAAQGERLRRQLLGVGAPAGDRVQPRIGAFEVSFKLVNTQSGRIYGPIEVFSKISTGHWPGTASKLVQRVQKDLQVFLTRDLGHGMLHQHVQAQVKQQQQQQPERTGPDRPNVMMAATLLEAG